MSDEYAWQPMDTIPEDGSASLCKLKSGHVIITWSAFEGAWLSEVTDLWVDAALDDAAIPDTSWESRLGWMPYLGPHPAELPEDIEGDVRIYVSSAGDDIPF